MSRTLLALLVPEAEPLVGELRARYDPAARRGLGAHITLVYPFLDSADVTADVRAGLSAVVGSYGPLSFHLEEVRTFPSTVWLAPTPPEPIHTLASAIEQAFPVRPTVGHAFARYTPHLTAARDVRRERQLIADVLRLRVETYGYVECTCHAVVLLESVDKRWRPSGAFPLGGAMHHPR
ncbi:2'-5' RNA ligase family protein [Dyella humicola]|uniref:2'-5' RNA ligase family protein n=1 Tax=Dyella humicola TaxID=2992126 RepID=UPI003CE54CC4